MKKLREYENKVLINKENFLSLLSKLKINILQNKIIRNYYFDTLDHSIFNIAAVFRIKEEKNNYQAIFKKGISKIDFDEYSKEIDQETLELWKASKFEIEEFNKKLAKYKIEQAKIIFLGKIVTHRYEIKFGKGRILIDHSIYNNYEDYEIECINKTAKNAEDELLSFCQKYKISTLNTRASKYARFLNTLKNPIT